MVIGMFSGFRKMLRATRLNAMADRIFSVEPPKADVRIAYGDDPLQFGDLRLPSLHTPHFTLRNPEGPYPVVVVIHGGFWRSKYTFEHIGHLAAALAAGGVATWSLEY